MLARNETIFKWSLYAAAAALCFLVQGCVLQAVSLWGVIPFLYPLVAAIPATYEGSLAGSIFALAVGVACDLLLPAPLPCFYTLVFPFVGLCGGLLAQSLLRAGFLCSLCAAAAAFLLTDGFHCLLLWSAGKAAWGTGASVMLREFCVTAVLTVPVTFLFRAVYRKTHIYD